MGLTVLRYPAQGNAAEELRCWAQGASRLDQEVERLGSVYGGAVEGYAGGQTEHLCPPRLRREVTKHRCNQTDSSCDARNMQLLSGTGAGCREWDHSPEKNPPLTFSCFSEEGVAEIAPGVRFHPQSIRASRNPLGRTCFHPSGLQGSSRRAGCVAAPANVRQQRCTTEMHCSVQIESRAYLLTRRDCPARRVRTSIGNLPP
jgi:hypothetical protein